MRLLVHDAGGSGTGQSRGQVSAGWLVMRLPTPLWVWLVSGTLPGRHRSEVWLERGLSQMLEVALPAS